MRSINAELEERRSAEAKKAEIRAQVAEGAGEPIQHFEPIMEEKRMYTVDSIEYRNAWTKSIIGRPLEEEERSALILFCTLNSF